MKYREPSDDTKLIWAAWWGDSNPPSVDDIDDVRAPYEYSNKWSREEFILSCYAHGLDPTKVYNSANRGADNENNLYHIDYRSLQ